MKFTIDTEKETIQIQGDFKMSELTGCIENLFYLGGWAKLKVITSQEDAVKKEHQISSIEDIKDHVKEIADLTRKYNQAYNIK